MKPKKAWFVCLMLAGLVALPAWALADSSVNQVGLYLEEDGSGPLGSSQIGSPFSVYLVLNRPTDPDPGAGPITIIRGFELTIQFDPAPAGNLFITGSVLPPNSIDLGLSKDITSGYVDFIVGIHPDSAPPVVDGAAVLVEMQFLALTDEVCSASLLPHQGFQSIDGELCFVGDVPEQLLPMYPISGSVSDPVFLFNDLAVPVETRAFGSVKALYR